MRRILAVLLIHGGSMRRSSLFFFAKFFRAPLDHFRGVGIRRC